MMKKISKRFFGAMLAIVILVSIVPNGIFKATAAATTQITLSTGDIINYGSYPQTRVMDDGLISALNVQPLQSDNTVTYDGSKYIRVYFTTANQVTNGYEINTVYWFKFEPIQCRVLSNTNGELFVMAEKILDSRAYNQVQTNVTWETCTMRSWLNNDFYNMAFNPTEQAKIQLSTVVNADNPWTGADGGNNTNDKLFLLSYADTINTAYGFSSEYDTNDAARRAQGTDFSKSNGLVANYSVSLYLGNSFWWLRSPGFVPAVAGIVGISGSDGYNDQVVDLASVGVRPAFKINLVDGRLSIKCNTPNKLKR